MPGTSVLAGSYSFALRVCKVIEVTAKTNRTNYAKELQNQWSINCLSLVNCALSNLNLNTESNKISCRDEGMC